MTRTKPDKSGEQYKSKVKNMSKKRRMSKMIIPTAIMGTLALVLLFIGYYKGDGKHIDGMKSAFNMILEIFPLLIFAFIVAGMAQVLLPQQLISKWIGTESGTKGILIGTVAGAFAPGGPYVSLPVAAALLRSGAGIGTMVAFLTGWSLLAFNRLPMEVAIMGWRFTLIRLICTFFFPPVAGLIAQTFFTVTR